MRTPQGVRLKDFGETWSVFSPLSGQTLLLNTEAAALLEVLSEQPGDLARVCQTLAMHTGQDARTLADRCREVWPQLLDAGLIEPADDSAEAASENTTAISASA
jgi:PqqD family protein of HPr-rel-A system